MDLLPGAWLLFKLHPGKLLLIAIEVPGYACAETLMSRVQEASWHMAWCSCSRLVYLVLQESPKLML